MNDCIEHTTTSDTDGYGVTNILVGGGRYYSIKAHRFSYEQAKGPRPDVTRARLRGQEYLLERRLFRSRSTGQIIGVDRKLRGAAAWTLCSFPTRWHYDILWGLDYLRRAGVAPDARVAEAIDIVANKRDADGRWSLENPHPGTPHFDMEGRAGEPSRWNTLRALRVLRWADRDK